MIEARTDHGGLHLRCRGTLRRGKAGPSLGGSSFRANRDPRGPCQGLQYDAVALSRGDEIGYFFGRGRGIEIELQPNSCKADRGVPLDAKGTPEIEVALGPNASTNA
jgi:hypothetical protein